MNTRALDIFGKRRLAVYRVAENIEHSSQNFFADGNGYTVFESLDALPHEQPFAFGKHYGFYRAFVYVCRNFGVFYFSVGRYF